MVAAANSCIFLYLFKFMKLKKSKFEIYFHHETAVHIIFGRRFLQVICFGRPGLWSDMN